MKSQVGKLLNFGSLAVIPTFAILLKATQTGLIANLDAVLIQLKRAQIFPNPELGLGAKGFLTLNQSER